MGAQPGARYLIVLLGVNDLGHPGTIAPESERGDADDLIAGYQQVIARAHERRMLVFGGTITPFETTRSGFDTPAKGRRGWSSTVGSGPAARTTA